MSLTPEEQERIGRRMAFWDAQPEAAQAQRRRRFDALTEMDTGVLCLRAVADLLNPDALDPRVRDNLAVLIGHLLGEYDAAREAYTEAAQALEDLCIKV